MKQSRSHASPGRGMTGRILSQVPGRLRLHIPSCAHVSVKQIETWLSRIQGVRGARANPLTGNILVHFDPDVITDQDLLKEVHRGEAVRGTPSSPQAIEKSHGSSPSLLRVGVRGLLGHAVVDSVWFATGYLGHSLGLPLAGLGPLHVLVDIAVWTLALRSERRLADGQGA